MKGLWIGLVCMVAGACGTDSGDGDAPPASIECEQGGKATTDAFLPLSVGDVWQYRVIPPEGGPPTSKRQEITQEMTPPGETEPVIVQVTVKAEGSTESWLRIQGDTIVRVRQQDFSPDGALEQTTLYDPPKIRLDGSAERTAAGATWTETYTRVVTDPVGIELSRIDITEEWTIVATGVACTTPWGEQQCLHVRRVRTVGGISDKEYFFARGYGKVLETGGQTEELLGCALH